MTNNINFDVMAGQRVYTPLFLAIYDYYVLGFSNRFIWRCPSALQQSNIDNHIRSNHLDIGVGTGYYLKNTTKNIARLGLLDINLHALKKSQHRLSSCEHIQEIELIQANILDGRPLVKPLFSSVSLNYLLHCLPGSIDIKLTSILTKIAPSLEINATVCGSTILPPATYKNQTRVSNYINNSYNKAGIFSNNEDSLEQLESTLAQYCNDVCVVMQGSVAIFSGIYSHTISP